MNAVEQIGGLSSSSIAAKPTKELGQEDFLKLLVAQLKNQDPNNPADNGEFLGQIAQFSMVSGIDDLGASFDGIAGSFYTNQSMQAASLIGKEVLVETNIVSLVNGQSAEGVIEVSEDAANVRLQIVDASGALVEVIELGFAEPGLHGFSWNGAKANGTSYPDGDYAVRAEGLVDGKLQAFPVQIFSKVESVSVDRSNTSISMNLANNQSVGFSQIREYR